MKKHIKNVLVLASLVVMMFSVTANASGVNYGSSKEVLGGLYYDGYVQCKPSYNDNNRHAARGYFTYNNGADGYKRYYTAYGKNISDSNVYTKSARYRDRWTLKNVPATTFNYNFDWVPHGSSVWPV